MTFTQQFRNALAALIGSNLPECVNRDDYTPDLAEFWSKDPPRGFFRLTDADKERALAELIGSGR